MAAAATKNIQLALALPARLRTFLARYPPATILPASAAPETFKTAYQEEVPNPFMPMKHPVTGRWHDPKYSLRRQAELVKMAREHGVEELLPFTPKGTETKLRKRVELGLRVKGTGVGQKVKGHKHERRLGVKYVWVYCWVWLGSVLGFGCADSVARQDGQEETSHVGHARTHQGMEEGKFRAFRLLGCCELLLTTCRLGNGSGPGSPNRRPEAVCGSWDVFRMYQYQCTTFQPPESLWMQLV
jgi:large subunit ribosomal protein L25